MFNYKDLIVSAAHIVWRNKYLWFFGFFSAFLTSGGVFQKLYSNDSSGFAADWQRLRATGIFDFSILYNIAALAHTDPLGLFLRIVALLVVLVLGAFVFWLAVVSQGALISGVAAIRRNGKMDFKKALGGGISCFWPVFFFRVIEKIFIVVMLALAALTTANAIIYSPNFVLRVAAVVVFIIAVIATFGFMLIIRYALSASIISGRRFIDAFTDGFALLKNNLPVSIEVGLVIFCLNVALGFAALMLLAAAVIPFALLLFVFYKFTFVAGLTFVLVSGTAALFVSVALIGALLSSFSDALWTILFLTISKTKSSSYLGRWLRFAQKK
ncbi:hypothetical protein A2477_00290 [Candidatus Falkowbacteria bacterium RIFOXYC2_FULL_47_12]|uniref:DUF4013 domain-containing protein n=2 Tax=Candidatus Falkowiibacteriota TaxID=1752728 RepID=A0A1F5TQ59_9BACT|nr:MAG: hypothetical protein A2242_03995 [Candidatus Falkowbacteria bacterium RIFOXYA2_FULL_47_9]OGF41113.1 MAG: hypothetical protein A2477_00290 [Candidatus Falkowbacteria bacterium RIFOXYC2_FULL_47_12]